VGAGAGSNAGGERSSPVPLQACWSWRAPHCCGGDRRFSALLRCAPLYVLVVVLMHGPQILQRPTIFATWSGAAEQLTLAAGGLASYVCLAGADAGHLRRVVLILMGICLIAFGLAHFFYLDFTASMVPKWLPGTQKILGRRNGVGTSGGSAAFLTGIQARLAAIGLTIMFAAFGVLIHAPLLVADPGKSHQLGHERCQSRADGSCLGNGGQPEPDSLGLERPAAARRRKIGSGPLGDPPAASSTQ